jgi:uncharacterized protein (DUF433 family)
MFDRIAFDPQIMGGRACIRGMRITVSLTVNPVANGMSVAEILGEYPLLEAEDIRQALQYAASLANEEIHMLSGELLATGVHALPIVILLRMRDQTLSDVMLRDRHSSDRVTLPQSIYSTTQPR